MFGLGMTEIIVILVVALIFFGPTKLPSLARSLGKAVSEFRSATNDLKSQFTEGLESAPRQPPAANASLAPPELAAKTAAAETPATAATSGPPAPEGAVPRDTASEATTGPAGTAPTGGDATKA